MLMRFDPFREIDRLFWGQGRPPVMPIDAYREGEHFVVRAERQAAQADGQEWLVNERAQGSFERQLFLGEGLDTDHIEASYEQGVLTVTIPVAEAAKPRKVEIAARGARAIEATAADAA